MIPRHTRVPRIDTWRSCNDGSRFAVNDSEEFYRFSVLESASQDMVRSTVSNTISYKLIVK
jgi:hypothetical protein